MILKPNDEQVVYDLATLKEVEDLLRSGIIFDGQHHKQYYLAEAAKKLGFDVSDLDLEDAIPA